MTLRVVNIYSPAICEGAQLEGIRGLCEQARDFENRGDYYAAREILGELWRGVGVEPDTEGFDGLTRGEALLSVGSLTCRIGSAEQIQGSQAAARGILTNSLLAFEQLGEPSRAAEACYYMALCFRNEGACEDARLWLTNALEREKQDGSEFTFRIWLLKAIVEEDDGQFHEALRLHEMMAKTFSHVDNHYLQGIFRNEFAIIKKKLGQAEGNYDYLDQALVEYAGARFHFQQSEHVRYETAVENNIATLLLALNRPLDAIVSSSAAVRLAERQNDKAKLAGYLDTHARAYIALALYDDAKRTAKRSVELLRFGGHHALLAESLTTYGVALARAGESEEAHRILLEAEEVAAHIENGDLAGRALLSLLEEVLGLDFSTHRGAHERIIEYFKDSQDSSVSIRHRECVKRSLEVCSRELGFKARMSTDETMKSVAWNDFKLKDFLNELEEQLLIKAFQECGGVHGQAAEMLGISSSCLNEKLKKYQKVRTYQTNSRLRSIVREAESMPTKHETDVCEMPDDSLAEKGIEAGDLVVYKSGYTPQNGQIVVLKSRGINFIGIYESRGKGADLCGSNEQYSTWSFEENDFEVAGIVLGFIKAQDAAKPSPTVHPL